jgi:hypothetical protein
MAGKKGDTPTPILDYKYQDKRKNIPTHELRDFVAEIEKTPTGAERRSHFQIDCDLGGSGCSTSHFE